MKSIFTLLFLFVIVILKAQATKQLWADCYSDSTVGQAIPAYTAADKAGNSYTIGYFQEAYPNYYNKHFFLVKYNALGVQQWVRNYPAPAAEDSTRYDVGVKFCLDNKGNAYVLGYRYDTVCNICTQQTKAQYQFVIKYDADGNVKWIQYYDGPRNTLQNPEDIVIDTVNSYLYITGSESKYNTSTYDYSNYLTIQKRNTGGKSFWIKRMPGALGDAVTFDKGNNVIVAGALDDQNTYQLRSPFVIKFNSNGDSLWATAYRQPRKNGENYFVKTDATGNIYVNGQTDTLTFYNNPRVATYKYSADGSLLWVKKELDHTRTMEGTYGGFAMDNSGNSYVASYVEHNPTGFYDEDWVITKYNKNGGKKWSTTFNGGIKLANKPAGIVVDAGGSSFITGYVAYNGGYRYATIKLDASGVQQWAKFYKAPLPRSNNFPIGIGIDALSNVYVSGNTSAGICTVKYGYNNITSLTTIETANIIAGKVEVTAYPNPCTDVLNVQFKPSANSKYTCNIYNAIGQLVINDNFVGGGTYNKAFNVQHLAAGVYLLQVTDGKTQYTQKFVKQ